MQTMDPGAGCQSSSCLWGKTEVWASRISLGESVQIVFGWGYDGARWSDRDSLKRYITGPTGFTACWPRAWE